MEAPAHVPEERVCPRFDMNHSTDYQADPFGYLREFRGNDIMWSPADGGYWVLTTGQQLRDCVRNPEVFSSRYMMSGIPPSRHLPMLAIPGEQDPPHHATYRTPMAELFSAHAVTEVEGPARSMARAIVERLAPQGHCDMMEDFAGPLPIHVFAQWFGIPEEDWPTVEVWVASLTRTVTIDPERAGRSAVEFEKYVWDFIDQRMAAPPEDDLFGRLQRMQIDGGRRLRRDELFPMTWELILGGMDTVSEELVWMFSFLGRSPEHQRRLVEEPQIVPQAVEELLRYFSYVSAPRYVTRDIEFHGVQMQEGDMVALPFALGSLDPELFPNPDTVDFDRVATKQMAFGWGPHRCLGMHLARRELAIALEEWHRLIPAYTAHVGDDLPRHGGFMPGYDHLPMTWTPA